MKPNQRSDTIRRLHCAAGHLNAVIKMAEAGEPCEQVLQQLGAVDAAIRAAQTRFLICQVQSSADILLDNPPLEQRSAELRRLQLLYTILMQNPPHHSKVLSD